MEARPPHGSGWASRQEGAKPSHGSGRTSRREGARPSHTLLLSLACRRSLGLGGDRVPVSAVRGEGAVRQALSRTITTSILSVSLHVDTYIACTFIIDVPVHCRTCTWLHMATYGYIRHSSCCASLGVALASSIVYAWLWHVNGNAVRRAGGLAVRRVGPRAVRRES